MSVNPRVSNITSKTVNDTTIYYIYEAHKFIGEYQEDGTAIKEYIYYGDTPIAVI